MKINNIPLKISYFNNTPSLQSKIPKKVSGCDKELLNGLGYLAFFGRCKAKKKDVIPPAEFDSTVLFKKEKGGVGKMNYKPSIDYNAPIKYKFIKRTTFFGDSCFSKFKKEYNPVTLEINEEKLNTYHISNFSEPGGTIAISTPFSIAISTDGLMQCIGVSFVDRAKNIQTLLHLCPSTNKKDNDDLIHYIISHSRPEDLEISVISGCYDETDKTLVYFFDAIKDCKNISKINFVNFPDKENRNLILKEGKLCCSRPQYISAEVNPKGKLIHAGYKSVFW